MKNREGKKKIRINVIGAGHWGPNVIRSFQSGLNTRVGCVCDRDRKRLKLIREHYPDLRVTARPEEAIGDPLADAIAIVTPVSTHYELAKEALRAGKDVFVEKPLADTVPRGRELVKIAGQKGRILMVGHIFNFNPGIVHAREVIRRKELGDVISVHAVRTNLGPVRHDVNALWDLGAHDLSIFNYWLDDRPRSVTASGIRHLTGKREDTVMATYSYPGGIKATIHASWLHPRKVREITVIGDRKMLVWSDMDLDEPIRIYDKGMSRGQEIYADTFGSFRMSIREGNLTIPPVRGKEPLSAECEHFAECVTGRKNPLTDGEGALSIMKALVAADKSLRLDSRVVRFRG